MTLEAMLILLVMAALFAMIVNLFGVGGIE